MPGEPKRLDHPVIVYFFGLILFVAIFCVLGVVGHHLTVSHHGPLLAAPILKLYEEKEKSDILDEARRIEEFEVHRHFHNIVDYPELPEKDRPVCFICHSQKPHSKSKKVRSLLNIHPQFFTCESCHILKQENEQEARIVYKWYNPNEKDPSGPFFGTDYDPETGYLIEVEDKLSRIAPYIERNGGLESALLHQDEPLARDYMKVRDKLTPQQRDGVKMKFHVNVRPKGHSCEKCHNPKSILDFKTLGFSDKRRVDLEQLNISGMITKYENFYLPNLYREDDTKTDETETPKPEMAP